ncbi:acetyl-CoA carboxylase biotin carboxylase subunit family protein [Paenibacillus chartarius]|uniref:Acetyl-CoA carboxylase biotin carboxylase subunit family protein n=1 Tax=Paenibacillus chartarius TaxID=747481 RepID=A0ABV6DPH5_9BACL
MMNFVFFSPHFPAYCAEFCYHLNHCGARVLGIGDVEYDALGDKLKQSLTEYRKVDHLEDYDAVLRTVGYYIHKYGKIDRFESLNEHWLELEAAIRTDFHIPGTKLDFIANLKQKSKMDKYFLKSGVKAIRSLTSLSRMSKVKQFAAEVGYPLVVKPNQGAGAHMTYKLDNERELEQFIKNKPADVEFILQEYIDGVLHTYDGLVNKDGEVVFAASHVFPHSIMDAVNTNDHFHYYCLKEVSPDIEDAGRRVIQAYGIKERFFHLEFFKSKRDGTIIGLEVNMRPPGTWMTDAINYSYDMDIYKQWATMVVHNRVDGPFIGKYYTGFASRKPHLEYEYEHHDIVDQLGERLVRHEPIVGVPSKTRGNYAYQFRSSSLDVVKDMAAYIQAVRAYAEVTT